MHASTRRFGARSEQGATAVEFAFVLPLIFALFYGALTYGLIFLLRMGLQHAAEDGARAALQYPVESCDAAMGHPCDADERRQHQYNARLVAAHAVATAQARWMSLHTGANPLSVVSRICPAGMDCVGNDGAGTVLTCATADCAPGVPPDCGNDFASSCQIVVTIAYDYAATPFLPRVAGFGLVTPDRLLGQARMRLDGRALAL